MGSCVGLRGVRIQNIVNELQGEKIDVLEWHRDTSRFIANGLNPAHVLRVELDPDVDTAMAIVPDRQLSLAIGKDGQNARLAAKLTGWNVDIKSATEAEAILRERERLAAERAAREREEAERLAAERAAAEAAAAADAEETVQIAAMLEADAIAAEAEAVEAGPTEEELAAAAAAEAERLAREQAEREREEAEIMAELEREEMERQAALEEEARREAEEAEIKATALRDVPENVWAVPTGAAPSEPSKIRFAEDISGLRGGVTVRRNRRAGIPIPGDAAPPPRGRSRRGRGRGRPARRRR